MTRRFELVEGTSNKFWEIAVGDSSHTVRFGKIGTAGQSKTKAFATPRDAQRDADKLVAEKVGKGYREVGAAAPAGNPPAAHAPAAGVSMTLKPPRGKPTIVISVNGALLEINGVPQTFASPELAKQHVDKLIRVRTSQGYTLADVELVNPPEAEPPPEPVHVAEEVDDIADVEIDDRGRLRITFEPEGSLTTKACAALFDRIARDAPSAIHVIGDIGRPGDAWAKGLAKKSLPSLRDLIFDTYFLTQSQQHEFSIGDLAATFAACPALERCFLTGTLSVRKQGTHTKLRELYLLAADMTPAFLLALATWEFPALERLVISLTTSVTLRPGADTDVLRVLAAKWPALRRVHVDGLHDVTGALASVRDGWTEARLGGDIEDEDALVAAVERDATRLRRLDVLGLPLALISSSAADTLRALCPSVRDIDELPPLTAPATYHAWSGARPD